MPARNAGDNGDELMTEKTCAACDCRLDESAIKVNIGTRVVEVCCDECAQKLGEAIPSAASIDDCGCTSLEDHNVHSDL
jgi:hypothetical protein